MSSSSSTEGVKINNEVLAPPLATPVGFSGPRIRSHKRPQLVDESDEDEGLSSRLIRKMAKVCASPERPDVEQGDSASDSSHSTSDPEPKNVPTRVPPDVVDEHTKEEVEHIMADRTMG